MAQAWMHPTLGRFELTVDEWEARVALPGFDAFTYLANEQGRGGPYRLAFEVEDGDDEPSAAAVAIAVRAVENQAALAVAARTAMWADFSGAGPRSGMWWHGRLDRVTEGGGDRLPPLTGPDALLAWMGLSRLVIHFDGGRDGGPLAEFTFAAEFEQEHSVGMLTDGEAIVGLGYSGDAELFGRE